jgi:glycosyltransferase involved in cell wall biosynthesis
MPVQYSSKEVDFWIVTSELSNSCGICKAVSTFTFALGGTGIVFTREYDSSSQTINDGWEVDVTSSRRRLFYGYADLVYGLKAHKSKGALILNTHDILAAISSSLYRIFINNEARIIATVYDPSVISPKRVSDRFLLILFKSLIRLGVITAVMVLDGRMERIARDKLHARRVRIIRIGVHPNFLKLDLNSKKKLSGKFRLYFQATIRSARRIEDVLEAIGMIESNLESKLEFIIGGEILDRSYYETIKKKASTLQSEVRFLNVLMDETEVMNHYRDCDIFIWPPSPQTWGLAPLEAMAFEKPVIVTTGSGVSEVLNSSVALVVPADSPSELALAITKLIQDDDFRKSIAKNAREFIFQEMNFTNTGHQLREMIGEFLN